MKGEKVKGEAGGTVAAMEARTEDRSAVEAVKAKKRTQPQAAGLRVALPDDIAKMVSATLGALKERGHDMRAEDLLKPFFTEITQQRLDQLLRDHTPDDYYLEQAKALPDVHALLIRHAKKAILQGRHPARARRKRIRPEGGTDAATSSSVNTSEARL